MGRLIDADKLRKQMSEDYAQSVSKISNPTVKAIVEKAVETFDGYVVSAETVKAIPEDWIKAYIEEVDAMPDKLVWGHDKNAILTMLRAWEVRKEQEGSVT